jgi:hypothetical protein
MIVSLVKSLLIVILVEEVNMDELSFNEYLSAKGITITGQNFSCDKSLGNKDIISQVNLIVELQKLLMSCNFSGLSGVRSIIGREIESYKVQVKKLQKHYDYIFSKTHKNEIENLILSNGKIMLASANGALKHIYEHGYYDLIKRSMNRSEICLGKIDKNNLRKIEGKIEIRTIKGMSFNLVEEDLYNYIKKLQRKEFNIDEEELIRLFVRGSHLSLNSIHYLRGLCSYPKDFLKIWERYRENNISKIKLKDSKKEKTNDELLVELEKSISYESKSFII